MTKRPRKTALLKAYARTWTKFEQVEITEEMRDDYVVLRHCTSIYANSLFEAQLFKIETTIGGVWQCNLIRHGDIEPATWEQIQRAIHDLFGPEVVAVEVYPAIQHEWQSKANLRVVWILPSTWELPFGLQLQSAWGKPA
jgi:hypothetical protein